MSASLAHERKVAIDAVLRASKLCQTVFHNLVSTQAISKQDKSPVTIADFGAQAVVNSILHAAFPNDPIVGEEDSAELKKNEDVKRKVVELANSVVDRKLSDEEVITAIDLGTYAGGAKGRFWTLDPIDGTKGFLRGEQFAVCLALIEDGDVKLGVMGSPNLPVDLSNPDGERGCLFTAVKGEGAFQSTFTSPEAFTRIHVSTASTASATTFCESVEAAHASHGDAIDIARKLGITKPSTRMDSQCKYGVIARGDAGIYLRLPANKEYVENIWDHAGGSLLVHEAGGKVSDAHGKPLDFSQGRNLIRNKGVVATNGRIHDEVMAVVGEVLGAKKQ
ncbi:3',5'-bisphosphate nucleotidase [Fimicolochytrium jonesii]|uniref:3',5'-bisphosphate nucleotidase n=1 Tax=Fimicolochytrium jonesii TaxID=1396493 RepID=UPI0022FE06A1|nr:3',5'-bisphosphate nucleotidase [Fimicolochytrium jonesii]KAI8816434.1 3',5'-bisphosphate nucleotidase [Fimicolochytrium jonesii]